MVNEGLQYLKSIMPERKIFTSVASILISSLIITIPSIDSTSISLAIGETDLKEIALYRDGFIGSLTVKDIFIATLITILSTTITKEMVLRSYKLLTQLISEKLESLFTTWKNQLQESRITVDLAKSKRDENIEKFLSMKDLLVIPNTIIISYLFLFYMANEIDWAIITIGLTISVTLSLKLSLYFLKNIFTYESIIKILNNKKPKIPNTTD